MKLDGDKDLVWDNDLLLQLFIQDDDVVFILRYWRTWSYIGKTCAKEEEK